MKPHPLFRRKDFFNTGVTPPIPATETERDGESIYASICANCHEAGVPKAPSRGMLQFMSPSGIYHALTEGAMAAQVGNLRDKDKRVVAEYLAGKSLADDSAGDDFRYCSENQSTFDFNAPPGFPGHTGPDARIV